MAISKETLGQLLRGCSSIGEVFPSDKGYKICCPFHDDTHPSAIVFYDTGVFYCLAGCGKKSLKELTKRLGIHYEPGEDALPPPQQARSLDELTAAWEQNGKKEEEEKVGVICDDPWWQGAGYRAIRADSLTPGSIIHERFKPSVVRLWLKSRGMVRQERYPRLALHHHKHAVYARLSEEQTVKYYNALEPSDPKMPPFGLASFTLPKKQLAGIIVTEGPYDVLRTIQNLDDLGIGKEFLVAALLGVSHWKSFFDKLKTHYIWQTNAPILLAFDNDKAGQDLTARALSQCETLLTPGRVQPLSFYTHDLGDCDKEGLKAALLKVGF